MTVKGVRWRKIAGRPFADMASPGIASSSEREQQAVHALRRDQGADKAGAEEQAPLQRGPLPVACR